MSTISFGQSLIFDIGMNLDNSQFDSDRRSMLERAIQHRFATNDLF